MPYTGDTTDFRLFTRFKRIAHGNISSTCNTFKSISIMSNTCNTTNVTGRTDNINVRSNFRNSDITFSHEADYTTDISSVCSTIFHRISIYITVLVYSNSDIGNVIINILTKHTANICHTVYFYMTGNLNIVIFGCIRSTGNNTYI